jgi:membrane-bound acyltransferase YfiQ involved in biofilm formation
MFIQCTTAHNNSALCDDTQFSLEYFICQLERSTHLIRYMKKTPLIYISFYNRTINYSFIVYLLHIHCLFIAHSIPKQRGSAGYPVENISAVGHESRVVCVALHQAIPINWQLIFCINKHKGKFFESSIIRALYS